MPVSLTDTSTSPSVTRAAISTEPPSGVNLTALVRRFSSTCLSFSSSAQTMPMSPAMSRRSVIPCVAARSRTIASPSSMRLGERHRAELELHPARLDLGEVEDLVDELEQVVARAADVAQVLLLALVELAEHPLEQDVGEPDHRVQRRAQLVRHAGQELGLVPAGDLELVGLDLELTEEASVVDGDRGLAGERLEQIARLPRELAGRGAPHDQRTDDLLLAHERNGEQRSPPVAPQLLGVGIQPLEIEVGSLKGLSADGGAADERLVDVDPQPTEGLDELRARADARPHLERPRLRVELEDRSAIGSGEPHRLGDDRRQHLVEVAARADGVADLSERPQLVDRAREVAVRAAGAAWKSCTFWIAIAPCAAKVLARPIVCSSNGSTSSRQSVMTPRTRWSTSIGTPRRVRTPPELAGAVPLVVAGRRRTSGIWTVRRSSPTRPTTVPASCGDRPVLDPGAVGIGPAEQMGEAVHVAVEQVDHARVGAAEPDRVAHDRLEHGLQLELPAPDDVEHLAGGRLLLDRLAQVPRELLDARVDGCSGFLVGGHGSSQWMGEPDRASLRVGQPYRGPPGQAKVALAPTPASTAS